MSPTVVEPTWPPLSDDDYRQQVIDLVGQAISAAQGPAGGGRNARRWSWAAVSIVLVVVSAGLWTVAQRHEAEPRPPVSSKPSIAVLAFADMTETGDRQYFADGVAEEILNHLSRSPDLRVVSRSSSFTFRDDEKDIPTISERLGVDFVLEGSVRGSGDQLRITAQLIETGEGFHLWSESYDRTLDDIFAIQTEIAEAILAHRPAIAIRFHRRHGEPLASLASRHTRALR